MGNNTRDRLINLRVNDAEYAAIKRLAKERGQSLSDLVRTLVRENEGREEQIKWYVRMERLVGQAVKQSEEIGQQIEELGHRLEKKEVDNVIADRWQAINEEREKESTDEKP